jgi:metal-responsive CopG/Arc/MetJ family transcriptional regulator
MKIPMRSVAKVAVSLPRRTLALVERERRRTGKSRSAVVADALDAWINDRALDEADRKYAEAYLRHPERTDEVGVVAAAVVAGWEPWD